MAVDAERLADWLRNQPADEAMALADLFVLGCVMKLQGDRKAGNTAVQTALKLCRHGVTASYCDALEAALPGNEWRFAHQVGCHREISRLLDRYQPDPEAP